MRFVITLLILAGTPAWASSDRDDDEPEPMPRRAITLSFSGHGASPDGESGLGPSLEYAIGHRRWQYFLEGQTVWGGRGFNEQRVGGFQVRGAAGVRWLARSFELDGSGGIEMTIEGFSGVQRSWWKDGTAETRPDIGFGFAWQLRHYRKPYLGFRFGMRAMFAPSRDDAAITTCRGSCPATSTSGSAGFMGMMGVTF